MLNIYIILHRPTAAIRLLPTRVSSPSIPILRYKSKFFGPCATNWSFVPYCSTLLFGSTDRNLLFYKSRFLISVLYRFKTFRFTNRSSMFFRFTNRSLLLLCFTNWGNDLLLQNHFGSNSARIHLRAVATNQFASKKKKSSASKQDQVCVSICSFIWLLKSQAHGCEAWEKWRQNNRRKKEDWDRWRWCLKSFLCFAWTRASINQSSFWLVDPDQSNLLTYISLPTISYRAYHSVNNVLNQISLPSNIKVHRTERIFSRIPCFAPIKNEQF